MKRILLVLSVVLLFASCGDKEISLVGTTWKGGFEVSVYQAGGRVDVQSEYLFDFVDDTSGSVHMKGTATMLGQPPCTEETDAELTYTFDGRNGVVTVFNRGDEGKDTPFSYDSDGDVLVMDISNSGVQGGVKEIVLHRQ